jgi:acetyl-CoA carboxylase carboxyltransferase component
MYYVKGKQCIVVANEDATVKAGALWFYHRKKKEFTCTRDIHRKQQITNNYLVDLAGVYLPMQDEISPR